MNKFFACALILFGCSQSDTSPEKKEKLKLDESSIIREKAEIGEVEIIASLSPKSVEVGDSFVIELRVIAPKNRNIVMPPSQEALPFQIPSLAAGSLQESDREVSWQRYKVNATKPGQFRVPAMRVVSISNGEEKEMFSKELSFTVSMPQGELPAITKRDGKLKSSEWRVNLRYLWLAPILLIILVALYLWKMSLRRRAVAESSVDPFERALARIRELEAEGIPTAANADYWYVELSSIVREFIESNFGLKAPERTTEEFLREAKRSEALTSPVQASLSKFLSLCDRVKFAGHDPASDESKASLDFARTFVQESRTPQEVSS